MTDEELVARLGEALDRFDAAPAIDRVVEVLDRIRLVPVIRVEDLGD